MLTLSARVLTADAERSRLIAAGQEGKCLSQPAAVGLRAPNIAVGDAHYTRRGYGRGGGGERGGGVGGGRKGWEWETGMEARSGIAA